MEEAMAAAAGNLSGCAVEASLHALFTCLFDISCIILCVSGNDIFL